MRVLILFLVVLRHRMIGDSPTVAAVGYLIAVALATVLLNAMAVVALRTSVAALIFARFPAIHPGPACSRGPYRRPATTPR